MKSKSQPASQIQIPIIDDYSDIPEITTKISLNSLESIDLKLVKKQLYQLAESANNLNLIVGVKNLNKIEPDYLSCNHFMKSCNRKYSKFTDLYMILKSFDKNTQGKKVHWIEVLD